MTSNLIIDNNAFNWEALSAIATCIIGFMTIFLTFYPLYLYHFSRKVKVLSFSNNCSKFHGDGFDLILLNKTLSPKGITKIELVENNEFILTIKNYNTPFILDPLKATRIIGDKYSENPTSSHLPGNDVYFIITVDGKENFVKYRGKIIKYDLRERLHKLKREPLIIRTFGNEFLSKNVKYALYYKNGNNYKSTLILDSGMIEDSPFSFNVFPSEVAKNADTLAKFIRKEFPKIDFRIQELK